MSDDVTACLDRLLREAEAGMQEASGGAAVCTFNRSGVPVPGIKYHEGRRAVLKELSRRLQRNPDQTTVGQEIKRDWSAALQRGVDRAAGPDWIAYRRGGLDALADVLSDPASTADHEAHGRPAPDGSASPAS